MTEWTTRRLDDGTDQHLVSIEVTGHDAAATAYGTMTLDLRDGSLFASRASAEELETMRDRIVELAEERAKARAEASLRSLRRVE